MKHYLISTLVLLGMSLNASADWNNMHDSYSGECVVYAGLVDAAGNPLEGMNGYDIAVFVGDECRGIVETASYWETTAATKTAAASGVWYFPLRVGGSASDNGKEITFKLRNDTTSLEYDLVATSKVSYQNESTVGTLNSLSKLTFVAPSSITCAGPININVGEKAILKNYLTVTPTNANLPTNITWDVNNLASYISLSGDTITALAPTDFTLELFPTIEGFEFKTGIQLNISQPITSMTVADDFKNLTVEVGASEALEKYLDGCLTLTPANATETPVWSSSNTSIINYEKDASGADVWMPKTAGTCTMTATAANGATATINVTVIKQVESMTAYNDVIYATVGDDLSNILKYAYTISPADATTQDVTYTVASSAAATSEVPSALSADLTAVTPGYATVTITSVSNPQVSVDVTVQVRQNTTINVTKDPLTYQTTDTDITDGFNSNFSFTPDYSGDFTITSSDNSVFTVSKKDNGTVTPGIVAAGSADITITISYDQTVYDETAKTLKTQSMTSTGKFTVNVTNGLTAFTVPNVTKGNNSTYDITITPEPESATYDISKVEVRITGTETMPEADPFLLTPISQKDGTLDFTIGAGSIGNGSIVVYYNGSQMGSGTLNVGQEVTPTAGWDWISLYAGSKKNISDIYGTNLVEARSQSELVYNDPTYGYFGDLNDFIIGTCYKVKNTETKDAVVIPCSDYNANIKTALSLNKNYNWIGNPYQFAQDISAVFSNPSEGDRIISKAGGFAEYNGASWVGSLTQLTPGQGYIYYTATAKETTLFAEASLNYSLASVSGAKAVVNPSVWEYDHTVFADNMTIIAEMNNISNPSNYALGAFVGDECRGEGQEVDGDFFITVHGKAGERVNFMLYDKTSGEYIAIDNSMMMSKKAGSLSKPVAFTADMTTTGISQAEVKKAISGANYNAAGQRVAEGTKGFVITKGEKTVKRIVK